MRASAVLAPLYEADGEAHVVLTRRAQHMRSHRGEVSFPGGGQEPGEDLWADRAARGRGGGRARPLDRHPHRRDRPPPHGDEPLVHRALRRRPARPARAGGLAPARSSSSSTCRSSELLADGVFREERWGIPPQDRPIYFFEVVGDTIWGATGAMLRNLLALVTGTFDPDEPILHWPSPGTPIPGVTPGA